jgi:hypothetical protein
MRMISSICGGFWPCQTSPGRNCSPPCLGPAGLLADIPQCTPRATSGTDAHDDP